MSEIKNIICFSPNTKITMKNGVKKIKDIKPHEIIISFNTYMERIEEAKVRRVATSKHSMIIQLSFDKNIRINCTIDHPIWVANKGWCSIAPEVTNKNYDLKVKELCINDQCILYDGNAFTKLKLMNVKYMFGEYNMHIISAGSNHCFFANGVLVHDENIESLKLNDEKIKFTDANEVQC